MQQPRDHRKHQNDDRRSTQSLTGGPHKHVLNQKAEAKVCESLCVSLFARIQPIAVSTGLFLTQRFLLTLLFVGTWT